MGYTVVISNFTKHPEPANMGEWDNVLKMVQKWWDCVQWSRSGELFCNADGYEYSRCHVNHVIEKLQEEDSQDEGDFWKCRTARIHKQISITTEIKQSVSRRQATRTSASQNGSAVQECYSKQSKPLMLCTGKDYLKMVWNMGKCKILGTLFLRACGKDHKKVCELWKVQNAEQKLQFYCIN